MRRLDIEHNKQPDRAQITTTPQRRCDTKHLEKEETATRQIKVNPDRGQPTERPQGRPAGESDGTTPANSAAIQPDREDASTTHKVPRRTTTSTERHQEARRLDNNDDNNDDAKLATERRIAAERQRIDDGLESRILIDLIDESIARIEKSMGHMHLDDADDIKTSAGGLQAEPCTKVTKEQIAAMVRGAPEPTFKPKEMLALLSGLNYNNRKLLEQLELAEKEGGFRLDNEIEYRSVSVRNGASAYQHAGIVHKKVGTLVDEGFVLGPFDRKDIPYRHLRISGIFIIKKKERGKYRLIFNLSAPEGDSINDGRTLKISIKYDSFRVAAKRLSELRRAMAKRTLLLGKEDIKSFYNRLAVRPHDWWQYAFKWFDVKKKLPKQPYKNREHEKIYMYRVAPFGAVASVEIAHQISRAVLFLYLHPATSAPHVPAEQYTAAVYVDDFLIAVTAEWAEAARKRLRTLLISIGLPLSDAPTKVEESQMSATKIYVGVKFDIEEMTVSVDPAKRARAVKEIDDALGRHFLTRKRYRSLVGTLNYLALCVRNGATFMRSLWNGLRYQGHKRTINLDNGIKRDLRWWRYVAPKWNGVAMMQPEAPLEHPEMRISTDATLKGFCMVNLDRGEFCAGKFPPWAAPLMINAKELITAFGVTMLWPEQAGPYVYIFTDNEASEIALRPAPGTHSRSTRSASFMTVMRSLWAYEAANNVTIIPRRVPTKENILADAGSRFDWQRFRQYQTDTNIVSLQQIKVPRQFEDLLRSMLRAQQRENAQLSKRKREEGWQTSRSTKRARTSQRKAGEATSRPAH